MSDQTADIAPMKESGSALPMTLGEERWLGRAGAHGVARLVRLVDATTGDPLGVEVRDRTLDDSGLPPGHLLAGPVQRYHPES
ncbi:hypothetical protein [Streptomyces sp. NPDC056405]|uniref:hypothetical protein n=1 Tax=Streptomyces sp. NPDC056405 TaxID=3345811 RepID=UPI0035DD661E